MLECLFVGYNNINMYALETQCKTIGCVNNSSSHSHVMHMHLLTLSKFHVLCTLLSYG